METKQINQLMVAMGRCGVKKLCIERDGVKVSIEREDQCPSINQMQEFLREENPLRVDFEKHKTFVGPIRSEEHSVAMSRGNVEDLSDADDLSLFITSPMVGTVYYSASPTEPSFIKVGDKIDKNTVVCIIEAMKVMNEVKSGVSGTVQEILVENGNPVEFGTKLIRVTPN